jgi:hypothetical protein
MACETEGATHPLPDETLPQHFSAEEIAAFCASGVELKSVTVLTTTG